MQITRKILAEAGTLCRSLLLVLLIVVFVFCLEGEGKPAADESESVKILPGEPSQSAKEEKAGVSAKLETQQRLKTSSTDSIDPQQRRTKSNDNNTNATMSNVTTALNGFQPPYGNENERNKEMMVRFSLFTFFFLLFCSFSCLFPW
jgi:hypothetical protein